MNSNQCRLCATTMAIHAIGNVTYDMHGDFADLDLVEITIVRNGVKRLYALSIVVHQSLIPTAISISVGMILYVVIVVRFVSPNFMSEL